MSGGDDETMPPPESTGQAPDEAVGRRLLRTIQLGVPQGLSVDEIRKIADDSSGAYEIVILANRPYTTAAIALGLGWLIGRSHRPF